MPISLSTVRIIIISDNKHTNDISRDEIIVISPCDKSNIKIKHYLSNKRISHERPFTSLKLTQTGMCDYIKNLVNVLCIDNEPCTSIQFDFPCSPSIIIDINYIKDNKENVMETIYDFCRMVEDSWFHEIANYFDGSSSSGSSSSSDTSSISSDSSSDTEMAANEDYKDETDSATSASSDHTPLEKANLKRIIYNTRSRTKAIGQAKAVTQAKGRHHLFLDD
jgi:hypothetical protein